MWVIDDQQYLGQLDGWNRAAQFADGLFETMLVSQGEILGIKHHIARMKSGLARLDIRTPDINLDEMLISFAHKLSELSAVNSGVLKVIVSRGDSQRGYGYDDIISPHVTAFYNEMPVFPNDIYTQGVVLESLETQCAIQPQMAGIKHLNRLENVLAKKELSTRAFEGLMYNHLGFVIEGTSSNVFFEKNNTLITPELTLSGVAGVMRECILSFAYAQNKKIKIDNISKDQLVQFDQGFICNSVMGIVPISSLDGRLFSIGTLTKIIQDAWKNGVIYA
jgi:4-amino-4-deoxychorismate lyase